MKFRQFLKSKIFMIFFAFFIIYVGFAIIFKQYSDLWWDAASFIGIGKYLFSSGHQGVFEPMKTILLPLILGLGWKLNINVIYFGKIFVFLVSMLSLFFLYLISRELFDRKTGFLAMVILFFNAIFFIFIFRIYTEMLSVCFALGAILFMIKFSKEKNYWFLFICSLFCVLTVLNKYPNALLFLVLDLFLLFEFFKNRKIRHLIWFNLFFLILFSPFLIANFVLFGNPIHLIQVSQDYFKSNLGALYSFGAYPVPKILFESTPIIYFKSIAWLFNILLPFMLLGIYRVFKEKDNNFRRIIFLILIPALVLFFFYEVFSLKQERYILPVFSLLAVFSAYELSRIKRKIALIILLIYILFSLAISSIFLYNSAGEISYQKFFISPDINFSCSSVATSDPRSVLNYNILFPYEVYEEDWNYSNIIKEKPECIFYFSCYSGRSRHISILNELNYSLEYRKDTGRCLYSIFKKVYS